MADLPSSIKVGPRLYTVHSDEVSYRKLSNDTNRELEGHSNHPEERIVLRPGRNANWTADTVLHETLHAIINLHGVDLRNVKDLDELEEYIVSVMSPLLLMVMRDNPQMLAFLLEPDVPWGEPLKSADHPELAHSDGPRA